MQYNKANTLVKRRTKVCQAKSEVFTRFSRRERHIFNRTAAAAAIGGINLPIGASNVVAGREAKGSGRTFDGLRRPFKLKKRTHGRFIQVQMKLRKLESGPKFLVDEAGAEAQGNDRACELPRIVEHQFTLEALLISCGTQSPAFGRRRGFGGEDSPGGAQFGAGKTGGTLMWTSMCWSLKAQAEEVAGLAEGRVWRVVDGVLLEDAAPGCGTDAAEGAQQWGHVENAQLDLDFADGGFGHG